MGWEGSPGREERPAEGRDLGRTRCRLTGVAETRLYAGSHRAAAELELPGPGRAAAELL